MARGRGTFGLTSSRGRGNFRGGSFRGGGWRGRGRGRGRGGAKSGEGAPKREDDGTQLAERFERIAQGGRKEGWLVNMHATLLKDADYPSGKAAVDYYFLEDDGNMFKATYAYEPYFYIACKAGTESTIEEWLMKKYEGVLLRITRERKEDLKLPNHLMGHRRLYLQLSFRNVSDLLAVRREIVPLALENSAKRDAVDAYAEVVSATASGNASMDIELEGALGLRGGKGAARDYDVPYYLRVAIDNDLRVGLWYTVTFTEGQPSFKHIVERVKRADPVVMAYDIETTKAPLKFPDQAIDQVMMISYMVDGQGYLITNREIVSEDISDFEYTPRDDYPGPFIVFNEKDEAATIKRFFSHIQNVKPTVIATFNGDFFDFPFLDARSKVNGIDMFLETGFAKDSEDEYKSRTCVHMDCFRWVKRDSYLPQGSQGLKAPVELDPELMTPYAMERPQDLATYSVSDAVATYYLYMKYVHPFIFSLCNIIPCGSGTLCETLLMVEAYRGRIIMPNRHEEEHGHMYDGHLLASETYVGGHVEALEAGIVPDAIQQLIDDLDAALSFCIVEESKASMDDVTNYDEVKDAIQAALELMRDNPKRVDNPLIYHLDVAAMYPNIMLSNRLQPDSMVDEAVCAVCDYNRPEKTCDRRLEWAWRGEFFPAHRDEYNMIRHALNQETFPPRRPGGPQRRFPDLSDAEQTALLHKRLGDYSRKVYKKTKDTKIENREAIVCQRENPFYVDTVRTFRDRRYEYKEKLDNVMAENASITEVDEAKKMIVLYDSLQLAHKCILNSFYGYVMRKGARWHSMEMAGITCLTGATIIQMARALVEQIGRPLELDTDGIWCMLPGVFPENFKFKLANGKNSCLLVPLYDAKPPCSRAIYEPPVRRPQRKLYLFRTGWSVQGHDPPIVEGRRQVVEKTLCVEGLRGQATWRATAYQALSDRNLREIPAWLDYQECYAAVAEVADRWLDILFTKAETLDDDELVELIAENRSMSRTLAEYGGQKSTSISTARRLAEFLGDQMVKDKGLACKFIISAKPIGSPVTDRAVPLAIFSTEESIKRTYLRKWLKDSSLANFDLRSILDWDYYIERLGSVIQKLITIPAAMQKVSNPVPRIRHPDWLHRRVAGQVDKFKQNKLTDFFKSAGEDDGASTQPRDIEDMTDGGKQPSDGRIRITVSKKKKAQPVVETETEDSLPAVPDPYAMRPRWKQRQDARWKNGSSVPTVVPTMFRGVKVKTNRTWDVIQIRPSKISGRFILWMSVDGDIVSAPLRIPREMYIHLRAPKADFFKTEYYSVEQVTRNLPRDLPSSNLYKIVVREDTYNTIQEHFIDLANDPNVDGVFEQQIPLVVRGLLKLGKSCAVEDAGMTLNRGQTVGFDLNQLDRVNPTNSKRKYLQGDSLKYIFLYHACSAKDPLHVFATFLPTGAVKLHIVDPATRRQAIPRLESTYVDLKEQREAKFGLGDSVSYPDALAFTTAYHTSDVIALKAISRELGLLEDKSYTVVISSSKDQSYYDRLVPKLAKFPVLSMTKARLPHTLDVFPWQTNVAKKMIFRYLGLGSWIDRMTALAEYYDVPIGHLEGDQPLFVSDLCYARRLVQNDMVLWWSPGELPDLGGLENDKRQSDDLPSTEFHSSGCFSNVCLEVTVRNLAVNSVMHSVVVNELEGSGGSTAFDSVSRTLDEYKNGDAQQRDLTLGESQVSSQAFSILRNMVKSWLLDKVQNEEAAASLAIDHFWRWISSSASQLYDSGLHRFVHGLMRKTFIQLLAEFRRLGSQIVYADFSRILLSTSKPPGTAKAYATYINSAVTSHELFQHIFLDTTRFYDYLIFMDNANMAAVVCEKPDAVDPPKALSIDMHWNIAQFLPPAVREDFASVVQFFLVELYKIRQKANEETRIPLRQLENGTSEGAQKDTNKENEASVIRQFLARRLTRKMLKVVGNIQGRHKEAQLNEEQTGEFDFPVLPGSYLQMIDPLLEFVKFVCAVFGLAKEYQVEIGLLKRNLLELIGVKEFAAEAIFRNPCEPLILHNVPCRHCDTIRDFDFCRDPRLLPNNVDVVQRWTCADCNGEYDRPAIEFTLINMLFQLECSFAQQDLRCSRCQQIQSDTVSRFCHCSGTYQFTMSKADVRRKLRTIVNVAIVHNLTRLKESAQIALQNW
ncbi:DUF1744-domain-containing protein [Hymenopellis radicata]|nr:DUF1744-domain-containing protein [Hymenopellis radicata]